MNARQRHPSLAPEELSREVQALAVQTFINGLSVQEYEAFIQQCVADYSCWKGSDPRRLVSSLPVRTSRVPALLKSVS